MQFPIRASGFVKTAVAVFFTLAAFSDSALCDVIDDPIAVHSDDPLHQCSPQDHAADAGFIAPQSPDFFETYPDGSRPAPEEMKGAIASDALAPAPTQPAGALTGKIVFTSGGHGWTYANGTESITRWYTQRGVNNEMNEDYGNMDQMTLFAYYCFNAGAAVVPMRPVGHQTNEVVLDNVSPGVTWSGTWTDSGSTLYFGNAGQVPYRFASIAATETATATYTPNIPVEGFYPVYAWARHGSDRTSQLYKIRHTGGEAQVRIPHEKVGNGWVYLGSYYFNAGSSAANGAVVISNLRPSPTYGSVVIADAIRFGNGMGNVVPTPKSGEATTVSSYPREEEASRYWIQRSLGQGQSASIYNPSGSDNNDNVGTPPRMAREMNRGEAGILADRVYVGFHSNAGGGRGCVGLYNNDNLFPGTSTPNQARLALLVATEVDAEMKTVPLEVAWQSRSTLAYARSDFAFGEIRGNSIGYEMDATIIEIAFHDEISDARNMRNPRMRNWAARATYQGIMRYFSEFDPNFTVTYLPEPPRNVRAVATNSGINISWNVPIASRRSGSPTNYVVYRSTDGYGFGNPVYVTGTATSITLSNLVNDTDYYFRVAAINAGGQSLPSEVVGCRRASNQASQRVLVVNAFTRLDRFTNLRHSPNPNAWTPPRNSGTMERVLPRSNNSFDYVVQHGKAINAANFAFDSCSRMAVTNGTIKLTNYTVVVWAAGQELVGNIDSTAQTLIANYVQAGGGLFVSGSEIARELGRASSPAASKTFFQNQLHATLASDAHTNSGSYTVVAAGDAIFAGIANGLVDNGTRGIYWVKSPEVLTPSGIGAKPALNYSGGLGGAAAVQYDGSAGGGRVVYFGFPFETINVAARRNSYMAKILEFLSVPPPAGSPVVTSPPASQTVNRFSDVTFNVGATGQSPMFFQWRFNGTNIANATNNFLTLLNVQTNQAGQYSVSVSNSISSTISPSATLTVVVPTVTQTFFSDNFDTNSSTLWTTNRFSADTRITFNCNYATNGIPSAPNSVGGTTRGVKFEANMTAGVSNAICMSPTGKSFTGDFDLRFDMWINANGPFPGGGNGSTEHLTTGVGTTGTKVQWGGTGTTADGTWFAVDGEGQAGNGVIGDYMAFLGPTQQTTNSGVYSAGTAGNARQSTHSYYAGTFPQGQTAPASQNQTGGLAAGAVGLKWRNVLVRKTGNKVEWFIDGLKIASIANGTFSGNNIFVGYWDGFASLSGNGQLSFGLIDNVRVERTTEAIFPGIVAQPQNKTVVEGSNVTFTVSATGTTNLSYQWRFDEANISGATTSSYTITNVQTIDEGAYSVVVSNVAGKVTSSNATLTVLVPPSIVAQPENQNAPVEGSVEFSVEAVGTGPLFYQWSFNGNPLTGATESSLSFTNVQATNAGNYFVTITNAAGFATSDLAELAVELPTITRFESFLFNDGQPQLILAGPQGSSYFIQISTNLIDWENLTNVVISDEEVFELIDISATNSTRFYRAISSP